MHLSHSRGEGPERLNLNFSSSLDVKKCWLRFEVNFNVPKHCRGTGYANRRKKPGKSGQMHWVNLLTQTGIGLQS